MPSCEARRNRSVFIFNITSVALLNASHASQPNSSYLTAVSERLTAQSVSSINRNAMIWKIRPRLRQLPPCKHITLLAASTLAQTASMAALSSRRRAFFSFALLDFLWTQNIREKWSGVQQRKAAMDKDEEGDRTYEGSLKKRRKTKERKDVTCQNRLSPPHCCLFQQSLTRPISLRDHYLYLRWNKNPVLHYPHLKLWDKELPQSVYLINRQSFHFYVT